MSRLQSCVKCASRIAACQFRSNADKERNFSICEKLVREAAGKGAKTVFLPEGFDYIAESGKQSVSMAEPLDGPLMTRYRVLAKELGVWLSLGGFHEQGPAEDPNRLWNSHVLLDDAGCLSAVYRKTHLFECQLGDSVSLRESKWCIPGKEICKPVASPCGSIGLMICYDLRFPEISTILRKDGADVLTYPSAFTVPTGKAHWEILLRARAVESQCYVVAAAQVGSHNDKRSSYGHSLIADPWGRVIARCGDDEECVIVGDVDEAELGRVRASMPVTEHKRLDLYTDIRRRCDAS